mgnify:CR=1 FL=1
MIHSGPVLKHDQEIAKIDDTAIVCIRSVAVVIDAVTHFAPEADHEDQVVDIYRTAEVEVTWFPDDAHGKIDADRLGADSAVAESDLEVNAHGRTLRGAGEHRIKGP